MEKELSISGDNIEVSGLLNKPAKAHSLLVVAHGAGAGMTHPFMENLSQELAKKGIATLRFNFPYMEKGRKSPGSKKEAMATLAAAVEEGIRNSDGLPVFLGGKSYGGRMATHALAEGTIQADKVKGLIFFGFPLHAPGKPGIERAAHLPEVNCPMLFLQGTRDKLAERDLIKEVTSGLPGATLHMYEGADHSFHVLKRSGTTDEAIVAQMTDDALTWLNKQQ